MLKALTLLFLLLAATARGDELLVPGSESPDHQYEVYAVDPKGQGGVAHLELREKATGRPIFDLGASGWVESAKGLANPVNTVVLWNEDGTFFILKMRDSKTSSRVTLYKVQGAKISAAPLPDFSKAIRKQLNFDFDGRFYFESPVKWESNAHLVLNIIGNTVDAIDPDGEYDFAYNVTVDVQSGQIVHFEETTKALPPPRRNNN